MLVAGRAFFVGPGCLVCPWAAARPLAVRAAICARRARHPLRMICLVRSGRSVCRWAAARPLAVRAAGPASVGLAAVCAGGRRPLRRPPHQWRLLCSRVALTLPPPTGTATVPSGPSGALHTCGAGSLFGSSTRRLEARPGPSAAHGHRSLAPTWTPSLAPRPSRPAPRPRPSRPSFLNPHPISHAIPPTLLQTLN